MRPSPFAALLCALFAFAPAPTAHGGEAGAAYGFAPPVVAETADGFLLADVEACASDALPGQPILPARTARILLPPDAVVRSVSAELEAPVVRIALAAPLAFGRAPVPMIWRPSPLLETSIAAPDSSADSDVARLLHAPSLKWWSRSRNQKGSATVNTKPTPSAL